MATSDPHFITGETYGSTYQSLKDNAENLARKYFQDAPHWVVLGNPRKKRENSDNYFAAFTSGLEGTPKPHMEES